MQLRIATCRPMPEPDADEELLLQALRLHGVEARMAAWNDPREDWDLPLPTLVRSTWDYIHDLERFRRWLARADGAGPLWNPLSVIAGNLHKRYLVDLAAAGLPVTPTELVGRGASVSLADLRGRRGWDDVIVKPAVSAGSFNTRRFRAHEQEDGEHFLASTASQCDMLVQPYLASVDGHGERALVWIDGQFTHAVRKSPRFSGGSEHVSPALPIGADERELGERVMAPWAADCLYARVDVAPAADGSPCLMELELVEPSLFLRQEPRALTRLAAALARRLAG